MNLSIDRVLETSLYVHSLEASRDFYTRVMGLKFYGSIPGRDVFLLAGKNMLLLFDPVFLKKEAGPGSIPQVYEHSRTHIAFQIPRGSIEAWKEHLRSHGVAIEHEETWDNGTRSVYFRDPDMNVVELAEQGIWPVED